MIEPEKTSWGKMSTRHKFILEMNLTESDYAFIHKLRVAAWHAGRPFKDYIWSALVEPGFGRQPTRHSFEKSGARSTQSGPQEVAHLQ